MTKHFSLAAALVVMAALTGPARAEGEAAPAGDATARRPWWPR